MSGALPRDNDLEQQWHESGSRVCQSSNKHYSLNICPFGASEVSMNIYTKRNVDGVVTGGLKLLGDSSSDS